MFFVYAIQSTIHSYIYIGLTENVETRVAQHNSGRVKSTKPYRPFKLIYAEIAKDRLNAREIEKKAKDTIWQRKFEIAGGLGRVVKLVYTQS
jgi:putative endonuclease